MKVYQLSNANKDGMVKFPVSSSCNEEYIREHYDFYIKEELGNRYRLHAKAAHSIDDFLAYKILCPKCHQVMTCVGGPRNLHELGAYACKCDNY